MQRQPIAEHRAVACFGCREMERVRETKHVLPANRLLFISSEYFNQIWWVCAIAPVHKMFECTLFTECSRMLSNGRRREVQARKNGINYFVIFIEFGSSRRLFAPYLFANLLFYTSAAVVLLCRHILRFLLLLY